MTATTTVTALTPEMLAKVPHLELRKKILPLREEITKSEAVEAAAIKDVQAKITAAHEDFNTKYLALREVERRLLAALHEERNKIQKPFEDARDAAFEKIEEALGVEELRDGEITLCHVSKLPLLGSDDVEDVDDDENEFHLALAVFVPERDEAKDEEEAA